MNQFNGLKSDFTNLKFKVTFNVLSETNGMVSRPTYTCKYMYIRAKKAIVEGDQKEEDVNYQSEFMKVNLEM